MDRSSIRRGQEAGMANFAVEDEFHNIYHIEIAKVDMNEIRMVNYSEF